MIAIISDIHGNLEALEAVLESVRQEGAERIFCLGDLVCHGPDSIACLFKSLEWDVVVPGEMDLALFNLEPDQWCQANAKHIQLVRSNIRSITGGSQLLQFLSTLPITHEEFGCTFTHGTPEKVREYLFPEHVYQPVFLDRVADQFEQTLFCGCSHIAGVFTRDNGQWQFTQPNDGDSFEIGLSEKLMCTVGSVGQPRDGDVRACFVLFDGKSFRFRRIDYDYETTIRKIKDDPDIDDLHGDRLPRGC